MIKRGLSKLEQKKYFWPPSAPEFAALCRLSAEDFDIPSPDECRDRVLDGSSRNELSPFEYTLSRMIGSDKFRLRRMTEKELNPAFKKYYDKTVQILIDGGELLIQPKAIEQDSAPKPADRETAMKHMEEIKQKLYGDNDGNLDTDN